MKIGKRQRVTDLRSIWPRETDFSDWLVTEDGLALLAEDLGIELEEPRRECRPGDFPCDIVAQAVGNENHVVAIENQFGRTDHDHLGKLLTYAAMNGAMTAIWITEHVSEDHRRVIDWLNDNTPQTASFYLASLKAYRIGDSAIAPQLDVVCRPNSQTKVRSEPNGDLKERHVWRQQMWENILIYIEDQNPKPAFRLQRPGTDAWTNIALGRTGFSLALTLTPRRQCIGCELEIKVDWKQDAYEQLLLQRRQIELEIGESLSWRELMGKKTARILLEKAIDPKNPANLEALKNWFYRQSAAFYNCFQPRVKQLQPSTILQEEEVD